MDEILKLMETLKIADSKTIGKIMASKGRWKAGSSSVVNSHKALTALTELGKLEKGKKFFRVPECRSEWKDHAHLITQALAQIIIKYPDSIIYREPFIQEVSLRPDAICLIKNGEQGRCIVLEVVQHESQLYLDGKVNTWRLWPGDCEYLSRLFGYKIPNYDIIALKGGEPCDFI